MLNTSTAALYADKVPGLLQDLERLQRAGVSTDTHLQPAAPRIVVDTDGTELLVGSKVKILTCDNTIAAHGTVADLEICEVQA
jgi:hypothetical protein